MWHTMLSYIVDGGGVLHALLAYRTAYKNTIGTTPYHLVYGKSCHV